MFNVWKKLGVAAGMVATVAVLLSASVMGAAAATTVANDSPAGAAYIDNLPHTVPVGKSLWYRFDYQSSTRAHDRTPIYLTLVNGNNSGAAMSVYTFDQVNDNLPDRVENWRQETPIGRGTAQHYNCDSHIPRANGECVSNNLTWVGTFAESGTYFVRIQNTTAFPTNFTLTVQGANVSLVPTMNAQIVTPNQ